MLVERMCVRNVDTADPGEPVQTAAARMNDRNVGCLVVENDMKQPIGIVTDRDLVVKVLAHGRDPYTTKVRDVMTKFPKTILEDEGIERAVALMRGGPFRRLPVVDARGRLVGLLTLDDLLNRLTELLGEVAQVIRREGPAVLAGG